MFSNELLFIFATLVEVTIVFVAARLGREWLFGTIAVNLILIGIFGAKLISVFGLVTNVGNVFYACVFLATHFLIERYGKNNTFHVIWFGLGVVVFFSLMSQFVVYSYGLSLSEVANSSIAMLFSFSPRVIIASILAYLFAQYINISIFSWMSVKTTGKLLWLPSNVAYIISQLVDSMFFFSIAFYDLSGPHLVQAIMIGWLLKSIVVLIGTPFLYFDLHFKQKKL